MPKRFTDSEKFRNPWYRKLTPVQKCIWEYLLSECSIAGFIEIDYDAMSFHIGSDITAEDFGCISEKLYFVKENVAFIPSFIRFQQKQLSRLNKAHNNIFIELEKYNIPENLEIVGFGSPIEGASKGLQSPPSNSKGNSKGKGNSKEGENYEKKEKQKNASRIPENWECSVELGEWAMQQGLTRDEVITEIDNFTDYWTAASGAKARKHNWEAAFRTWIRNSAKWKGEKR